MKHHEECMIDGSESNLRCSCTVRDRGARARDMRVEGRDVGTLYERNFVNGDVEYLALVLDARRRVLRTAVLDVTTHKLRCLVSVSGRASDGDPFLVFEAGNPNLIVVVGKPAMRPSSSRSS